jgi:choloylglycine hydrolase
MKKKLFLATAFVCFLIAASVPSISSACTDFQVRASDGSVIIGRSMEFAVDVKSQILVNPRGEREEGGAPDGGPGLTWTSKYGYLSVNAFGIDELVIDGMNEAGLSIEGLWLPGTVYQSVSKKQMRRAINAGRLGAWILASFKNVGEVRKALGGVRVWLGVVPQLGIVAPVHFAVHDADGKNIVIEFIGGEIKIHDNPVGVMTNAPSFDWHMTNLRNYVNLSPDNAGRLELGGTAFTKTGNGSGMLGVPGDFTPPSRFVRTAMLAHFSNKPKDAQGGVNLAAHILNSVDIPRGSVNDREKSSNAEDYTQWVIIKDLTGRALYVRCYDGMAFRKIDLNKLSFEKGVKTKSVVIESAVTGVTDITGDLL